MTPLRQRMIQDLQLKGYSKGTQENYVRAMRQLCEHFNKPPGRISDENLREFFLYVKDEKNWSRSTSTIALCGIKFFYENTLKRPWPTLLFIRPGREKKLPVIASREEVKRILSSIRLFRYQACLTLIYSCGLRLSEGIHLRVEDIDSDRGVIHIKCAKGNKDRMVPLPQRTLHILREQWKSHRNPDWIFPSANGGSEKMSCAASAMSRSSVQSALRAAVTSAGIHKRVTVHSLRHSWATHLLEAGINLRLIQFWLGHSSPRSTSIYTHLTDAAKLKAMASIDELMNDL